MLGIQTRAAGLQAQAKPRSYGGFPNLLFYKKVHSSKQNKCCTHYRIKASPNLANIVLSLQRKMMSALEAYYGFAVINLCVSLLETGRYLHIICWRVKQHISRIELKIFSGIRFSSIPLTDSMMTTSSPIVSSTDGAIVFSLSPELHGNIPDGYELIPVDQEQMQ